MGKKDEKRARADIGAEKQRQTAQVGEYLSEKKALVPETRARTAGYRDSLLGGYKDLKKRIGTSPEDTDLTNRYKSYGSLQLGPDDEAVMGGYKGLNRQTFGADENMALEGYKDFATTGGFRPGEADAIRTRASMTPTGYYASLSDRLSRMGGYNPSLASASSRLARQGAQAGAEATLGADLGIAEATRSGRLSGLAGIESLTGARRQEALARELESLGGQERLTGAHRAEAERRGLAGIQGMEGVSRSRRAEDLSRELASLEGIRGLYTSVPGEETALDATRLQAMGLDAGTIAQLLGLQSQLASRPGAFENILRGVGAGAGVVTGIGGMRW